jgi:cell shape-determining protein MreC
MGFQAGDNSRDVERSVSISQVLFDAIQSIEAELQKPAEYGPLLGQEIADLLSRMKELQERLDQELTEIESDDD